MEEDLTIEALMQDVIVTELQQIKNMEVGTPEHKNAVDCVTKLVDKAIEMDKIQMDMEDKKECREKDAEVKERQMEFERNFKSKQQEEEKKDRLIKNSIAVVGIVIPAALTIWGTLTSFKFEREGTVTTIMGRGFVNKLLPKK